VAHKSSNKLAAKYFGPFPIIARIGTVAYKLQLPADSKIHPVFHISLLRQHVGARPAQSTLPAMDDTGVIAAEPVAILDRRLGKVGNKAVVYLLIQWSTGSREEATWDLYSDIEQKFPDFDLQA